MSEAEGKFLPAPKMSAQRREPATGGQGAGRPSLGYLSWPSKKGTSPGGASPAGLPVFGPRQNPGVAAP